MSLSPCVADEIAPVFAHPVFFATGEEPWGLAAADAYENGYPDLAVTHCERVVRIYKNTGNWGDPQQGLELTQTLSLPESTCLGEVEFAHMNPATDDNLDLVVAQKWGRQLYVFLADPDNPGEFPYDPGVYSVSHNIYGLVVADLDTDGYNDVALAGAEDFVEDHTDNVFLLWNKADGTGELEHDPEEDVWDLELGRYHRPHDLVVGDFKKTPGLIKLDLVTANEHHDSISVLTNLGSREFSVETIDRPPSCQTSLWRFRAIVAGRFDLGRTTPSPDLACRRTNRPDAAIFHSDAQGGFEHDCEATQTDTYQLHPDWTVFCWGADCGHLNGGTKLDLAFVITSEDEVSVLLGKGDGTFQTDPQTGTGYLYSVDNDPDTVSRPRDVRIVDLDMDGFADLVTTNNHANKISVLINKMIVVNPPAPGP